MEKIGGGGFPPNSPGCASAQDIHITTATMVDNNNYDEKFRRIGLTIIEERITRSDLIETFEMVKGMSKV